MRRLLAAIAVLALGLLPAVASARYGVSGSRKAAITKAAFGAPSPQCYRVYISSASRFWASAEFDPTRGYVSACQPYGSNGVVILRHRGSRWRIVTEGSSFSTCPASVPIRIARDLRVPCP
jgi:hypothetical protein